MSNDDRQIEKAVSRSGKEYTTERPAAPASPASKDGREPFGISVVWRPHAVTEWVNTPNEVRNTASITRYMLTQHSIDGDGTAHCTLQFTNTKHYDYYFYDQTGDGYMVTTLRSGDHSVNFSSKKPTILFIAGE